MRLSSFIHFLGWTGVLMVIVSLIVWEVWEVFNCRYTLCVFCSVIGFWREGVNDCNSSCKKKTVCTWKQEILIVKTKMWVRPWDLCVIGYSMKIDILFKICLALMMCKCLYTHSCHIFKNIVTMAFFLDNFLMEFNLYTYQKKMMNYSSWIINS